MALRIISGKYKSRKINSLPLSRSAPGKHRSILRPTTDRARVMLFDIISNKVNFKDIKCLDLFAGTGSFGFECLSRGAVSCTFVDYSAKCMEIIRKTAAELDCLNQTDFIKDDVLNFLNNNSMSFDVIFADPPYGYRHYSELSEKISGQNFTIGIIEFSGPASAVSFVKSGFETEIRKAGITNFKILTEIPS